jgi:hypothetical protein
MWGAVMMDNVVKFPGTSKAKGRSRICSPLDRLIAEVGAEKLADREQELPKACGAATVTKPPTKTKALGHFSLKKQREARYNAWEKAGAATDFFEALENFYCALLVAQRSKLPEALRFDVVELDDARWRAAREARRDATANQLLTPAPTAGAVLWKKKARRQSFSGLPRDRIEKAIADDQAWLRRHPASDRCHLRRGRGSKASDLGGTV